MDGCCNDYEMGYEEMYTIDPEHLNTQPKNNSIRYPAKPRTRGEKAR